MIYCRSRALLPQDYPVSALEVYSVAGECASVLLQLVSGKPVRLPEPSQGDCYASELVTVARSHSLVILSRSVSAE